MTGSLDLWASARCLLPQSVPQTGLSIGAGAESICGHASLAIRVPEIGVNQHESDDLIVDAPVNLAGIPHDAWVRHGAEELNRLRGDLAFPEVAIERAVLLWQQNLDQLPFIRALLAAPGTEESRLQSALLVDDPVLGGLQYRITAECALEGYAANLHAVLDGSARRLRISALRSSSSLLINHACRLSLPDPAEHLCWLTAIRRQSPRSAWVSEQFAECLRSIWEDQILPRFRASHFCLVQRFLRSRIPDLPDWLDREGLSDSGDLALSLMAKRPQALYRRALTLRNLPGFMALATAQATATIRGEPLPIIDSSPVMSELMDRIEEPFSSSARSLTTRQVRCLSHMPERTLSDINLDLEFAAVIIEMLPQHLVPNSGASYSRFGQYFAAIRSPRVPLIWRAGCHEFSVTELRWPTVAGLEVADTVDFLDWCAEHCGIENVRFDRDATTTWMSLGGPTLTRLVQASQRWHRTEAHAQAALSALRSSKRQKQRSGTDSWPPLLESVQRIGGYSFRSLTCVDQLAAEGSRMSSCVGRYKANCLAGDHIVSIESEVGPVATMTVQSVLPSSSRWQISACRGPKNRSPEDTVLRAANMLINQLNRGEIPVSKEIAGFPYRERSHNPRLRPILRMQKLRQAGREDLILEYHRLLRFGRKSTPVSRIFAERFFVAGGD